MLAAGQSLSRGYWSKALQNKYVLSLDLNTDSESTLIIVSGNEFQTVGAKQRKARLAKSVLVNGLSSSWTADERSVDWGMSVLWRCCDSWRSTQPPCTRFSVKWVTNAAHAVMAGDEIVLEPVERSWLHSSALAAEPECCWLDHRTALSCSSLVWSVWDCKPVSPRVLWTVDGVYGGWPENDSYTIVLTPYGMFSECQTTVKQNTESLHVVVDTSVLLVPASTEFDRLK